jgi:hypothetical protein
MSNTSSSLGLGEVGTGSTGGFAGFDISVPHHLIGISRLAAGGEGSVQTIFSSHTHMSGAPSTGGTSASAVDTTPTSIFFHYPLCRGTHLRDDLHAEDLLSVVCDLSYVSLFTPLSP